MLVLTPVSAGPVPPEDRPERGDAAAALDVVEEAEAAAAPGDAGAVPRKPAALDGGRAAFAVEECGCAATELADEFSEEPAAASARTGATPGGVWASALPRVNTQP